MGGGEGGKATAKENTGILRCAQDDDIKLQQQQLW
jgi:hypothetical protein